MLTTSDFGFDISIHDHHGMMQLVLAQDDGGPSLRSGGQSTSTPGAGGAGGEGVTGGDGGAGGGNGAARPASPFGPDMMLILVMVFVFIILWSILGQRREKKKREAMLDAVQKHDRVQTIGGAIGTVVELRPDTVVLKVDESSNTRMTFSRSAIQQVLTSSTRKDGSGNGATDDSDTEQ
ncbi:MAG: preprotein translocase subunit YajC [Phycisphaerales bacterium]